jgi:hypothetical protein
LYTLLNTILKNVVIKFRSMKSTSHKHIENFKKCKSDFW